MRLMVIDGNSILNRAFYGIKLLTTKDGKFTNGIYGFMTILLRLTDEVKPDAVVLVVSEESGIISIAQNGIIIRRLDRAGALRLLCRELLPKEQEQPHKQLLKRFGK